jgi:hypothetical protein
MESTEEKVAIDATKGINSLADSLSRSGSQIKKDRALEISEGIEIDLKRKIEDLQREIKIKERQKKSAIDMSPDNAFSIIKTKDFDPLEFINNYDSLNLQLRELKIKLNNSCKSYNELFGNIYEIEKID